MVEGDQHSEPVGDSEPYKRGLWPRRWRWRISLSVLILFALVLIGAWFSREQIAGNVINDLLAGYEVEADYDIIAIDPQRQIIENLVIGDPAQPDFTADRVTINLDYGFRTPTVEGAEIVGARLYGTYLDGKLSFGSLDPIIFAEAEEEAGLPDFDLGISDGRALIESEFGAIAAKLDGAGSLQSGFAGTLAATAPGFGTQDCSAQTATVFGDVATDGGEIFFSGPVRFRNLSCEGAQIADADIGADFTAPADFGSVSGDLALSMSDLRYEGQRIAALGGDIRLGWGEGGLNLRHDLDGEQVATAYGRLGKVSAEGALRSGADFTRIEWDADLSGQNIALAGGFEATLDEAQTAAQGTLAAPLLAKFQRNFKEAMAGGAFASSVTIRKNPDGIALIVPDAQLSNAAGETLAALSRFNWTSADTGRQLSGNFVTGGAGLPQINGRMEQSAGGALVLRMGMEPYAAGADRLAIPRLQIEQSGSGRMTFAGSVFASGALPGGSVRDLVLPMAGSWSEAGGFRLGERCTQVQFGALTFAQLELQANALALCPQRGGAIIRYDDALSISAETRSFALTGELADAPANLRAESASFSYPGGFALADVNAVIGEEGNAVHLTAQSVEGGLSGDLAGTIAGGSAQLDLVPLDLTDLAGGWAYRDETLVVDGATFVLTERIDGEERFEPLVARNAHMTLSGGEIAARADLLNPASNRLITKVTVDHDLGNGAGQAVLDVPGVVFDDQLAPEDLTYLAKGVIAFADGTVSGEGLIEWQGSDVTSTGTFGTDGLDLAAAFGPLDDVSGTVEFTDLLGLTTAPGQLIEIGAVNPGIEVLGGSVQFSMTDGELIALEDARWPFMGGTLILRPVTITYGTPGSQNYVFEIIALDAATFVAQMELSNIGAAGTFDGTVPISFDDDGNGVITGGLLLSRPPGGNVSYIGELTYEDLGAISNYAFQSLRSLDYRQMSIALDGNVAGEIITKFQIDGVRQGEGASRNFITRRLANLPIRFNINVRSESFTQLALIARGLTDPSAWGDAVDRGIFEVEDGRLIRRAPLGSEPDREPDAAPVPDARNDNELPVQPVESDNTP
ncbi:YdbH domain-containing protein [Erythrobacter sp. MTPC3]|uniref:intermembrane phospholipid transport protein YdbH family protein n=1 Tax=Erythrobacter sp. MTPC3 TaxID=3056564 RepID=UPI0036F3FA8D